MDAQSCAGESTALLALATACVAQAALDYDAGRPSRADPGRLIEENFWRAIRYGLDGRLIDFDAGRGGPGARGGRAACWSGRRARVTSFGSTSTSATLEQHARAGNGAQRQWRRHEAGEDIRTIYAATVRETRATYAEAAGAAPAVPCGGAERA